MLGFDDYPELAERLADVLGGHAPGRAHPRGPAHLLPLTPVDRPRAPTCTCPATRGCPPHAAVSDGPSRRSSSPPAATGAARSARSRPSAARSSPGHRTTSSPRPRGSADAGRARAGAGERELHVLRQGPARRPARSSACCRGSPHVPGIDRVRVSYLQPAETRPGLIEAIASTPGVAPYFDLSFQHASPPLLRRMRRFGSRRGFLDLCARIRALAPEAGIRSNVIVGLPRRDRGRPRRAGGVPRRRPARRRRRLRLLRRGRHRGRELRRQAARPRRSPRGSSGSRRSPRS